MNPEQVLQMLGELRVLPFFPGDEASLNAIVRLCGMMCASEDHVRWLVDRMTSGIYQEWPGIAEMRACYFGRYKPKDGINAYSTVYPDGLPSDPTAPPRPEIAAPSLKALPPGHGATADPHLERAVTMLADVKNMNHPRKPAQSLTPERRLELETAIEAEVAKRREAQRREIDDQARWELDGGATVEP